MNQTPPVVENYFENTADPDQFTAIVEQYQNPVYHLCVRMLGDPAEAEDAAQETFWKAYKNMQSYDSQRPFLTWLLSIAAHHCIDHIRKRKIHAVSIDVLPDDILPDHDPGPEGETILSEDQIRIRNLLHILSPEDRTAVILRYWYDFSDEEIGNVLHLTVGAVKSRLFRARKLMAKEWLENENTEKLPPRRSHEPSTL